jgi:nucleoside diphosphate kinase
VGAVAAALAATGAAYTLRSNAAVQCAAGAKIPAEGIPGTNYVRAMKRRVHSGRTVTDRSRRNPVAHSPCFPRSVAVFLCVALFRCVDSAHHQERTFIAIKPDGVQRGLIATIIGRFEQKGFTLVGMKMLTPTKEQAEGHYEDLNKKPFFKSLTTFFSSGPIVAMVRPDSDHSRAVAASRHPAAGACTPQRCDHCAGDLLSHAIR